METDKISVRIPHELKIKLDRRARGSGRNLSNQIIQMLKDSLGVTGQYPCILYSGNSFLWISPTGAYGEMNHQIYKRFIAGSLPINVGVYDDWMKEFEDMETACKALGQEICRQAYNGLYITDVKLFREMQDKYME